jgi:hypothetical protein
VSGSTIPIFTGVSARARIGNGAAMAPAVHASPALSKVRRGMDRAPVGVILPIVGSATDVARTYLGVRFDEELAGEVKGSFGRSRKAAPALQSARPT